MPGELVIVEQQKIADAFKDFGLIPRDPCLGHSAQVSTTLNECTSRPYQPLCK